WNRRLTIAPRFSSRKVPETPCKTGSSNSSCGSNPCASGPAVIDVPTTVLFVSAPVGQETMHSPHEMHGESPLGAFKSKAIPVEYPFPIRPSTKLFLISSQPRMHRSHNMHASWSTAMASEESSLPRETVRLANRGCVIPAARANVSSSQSPEFSCRAHGDG